VLEHGRRVSRGRAGLRLSRRSPCRQSRNQATARTPRESLGSWC
jgi:hypothetical protein